MHQESNLTRALTSAIFITFISIAATVSGCSHTSQKPEQTQDQALSLATRTPSKIEIEYTRERDCFRMQVLHEKEYPWGEISVNHRTIEKGQVDLEGYDAYLKKVSRFISTFNKSDSSTASLNHCRIPFLVRIQYRDQAESARGCRISNDTHDANLSKLIRDGEFLLYSKK